VWAAIFAFALAAFIALNIAAVALRGTDDERSYQ